MPTYKKEEKETRSKPYHSYDIKAVLSELKTKSVGLSLTEARKRLKRYGSNLIPEKQGPSPFFVFLKQFHSILIYVLLSAAFISYLFNHLIDVYVILAVVFINAVIGFVEEYKAEKAIRALQQMVVLRAKVLRDGKLTEIEASELVPGDIVLLKEGDKIPADCRLIEVSNFKTVEASLTGEAFPIDKNVAKVEEATALGDRNNMVWLGTFAASGEAKAVVIGTGLNTALGHIARDVGDIRSVRGHFERKTATLVKQVGMIAFVSAVVTFLVGFFIRGFEFAEIFLFTVAILVSGIPEGLPAILIVVLAIGVQRMARRNAIIRHLASTETLGIITDIVTDKTGTITRNTMNVEEIYLFDGEKFEVTGKGWDPKGDFYKDGRKVNPFDNPELSKLINITALYDTTRLVEKGGKYDIVGNPTEAAMVVLGEKAGLKADLVLKQNRKIEDYPFNQQVKLRAGLFENAKTKNRQIYAVGAPETILERSKFALDGREEVKLSVVAKESLHERVEEMAGRAVRVLAVSYKRVRSDINGLSEDMLEDFVFVGLVGIIDPPRPEVKEAILKARGAGIRVIMCTGDHKTTAVAVSRQVGLIDKKNNPDFPIALTETELLNLDKKEFSRAVRNISVFARLTPNMKLKIVEELQRKGSVVAMTGDGVNDAPALKKADVGVSMGIMGTDVARESSEMVLADDNFASIVNAVEEGRIVFTNTRQSSFFLVTTNFAETVSILSMLFLGLPLPLLPTQILWLNLVTDGVSGVSLAAEPGHGKILKEPPRKSSSNILSRDIIPFLLLMVGVMVVLVIAVFTYLLPYGVDKARTGAFAVMAFTQLFNMFNMRSLRESLFSIGFFTNKYVIGAFVLSIVLQLGVMYIPFLRGVFRFEILSVGELFAMFALSSMVVVLGEAYKLIRAHVRGG